MECVFTSEINDYSRKTYSANFKDKYLEDEALLKLGGIYEKIHQYQKAEAQQLKKYCPKLQQCLAHLQFQPGDGSPLRILT